jgi:hypothetical protein
MQSYVWPYSHLMWGFHGCDPRLGTRSARAMRVRWHGRGSIPELDAGSGYSGRRSGGIGGEFRRHAACGQGSRSGPFRRQGCLASRADAGRGSAAGRGSPRRPAGAKDSQQPRSRPGRYITCGPPGGLRSAPAAAPPGVCQRCDRARSRHGRPDEGADRAECTLSGCRGR